jgi:hypothetical protein
MPFLEMTNQSSVRDARGKYRFIHGAIKAYYS